MSQVIAIIIQLIIVLGILFVLKREQNGLLDKTESMNWKGLFCILIVQFHTPTSSVLYRATGFSSAFIATTIFSMMAAYGVSLQIDENELYKNRLLEKAIRLLIIYIVIRVIMYCISGNSALIGTRWVNTILLFYFSYYIFQCAKKYRNIITILFWILYCVISYTYTNKYFAWPGESLGYAYGIILANYKKKIEEIIIHNEIKIYFVAGILSILLGLFYSYRCYYLADYSNIMYVFRVLLTACVIVFFLDFSMNFSIKNKLLYEIGKICIYVFLVHSIFIELLKNILDDGYLIATCIILSVLSSLLLHQIEDKINRLVGNKK